MPNQSHTRVFGRDILHHTPRINQNFQNDQIDEEEQFEEHDDDIDATTLQVNEELHRKTTQVRGPTRMYRVWNGKNHNLMEVPLNELGQPCGDNATSFTNFLGTIVRNSEHAPLNYIDWRHMPQHFKERMWGTVKLKCNVNDEHKDCVMKTLHKNRKEFKCELRRKHYYVHDNDEDRLADRDPRLLPEQWEFLVEFFGSEKGQRNKNNRAKQVTTHTTGSKSFARVREEARKELNVTPNRSELFKLTHVRKNGAPINEDVAEKIREIDELTIQQPDLAKKNIKEGDLFSHVFGEDGRGHARGLGLGPTHSNIWGGKPSRSDYARISNEKITQEEEEIRDLKEVEKRMEGQLGLFRKAWEHLSSFQHGPIPHVENMSSINPEREEFLASVQRPRTPMEHMACVQHDPVPRDHFAHVQNGPMSGDEQLGSVQHDRGEYTKRRQVCAYNTRDENNLVVEHDQDEHSSSSNHVIPTAEGRAIKRNRVQANVSNQDEEVFLFSVRTRSRPIARGVIVSKDSNTMVGGEMLGKQYWEIFIEVVIQPNEGLIRSYENMKTIGDAAMKFIAWPSRLVKPANE